MLVNVWILLSFKNIKGCFGEWLSYLWISLIVLKLVFKFRQATLD